MSNCALHFLRANQACVDAAAALQYSAWSVSQEKFRVQTAGASANPSTDLVAETGRPPRQPTSCSKAWFQDSYWFDDGFWPAVGTHWITDEAKPSWCIHWVPSSDSRSKSIVELDWLVPCTSTRVQSLFSSNHGTRVFYWTVNSQWPATLSRSQAFVIISLDVWSKWEESWGKTLHLVLSRLSLTVDWITVMQSWQACCSQRWSHFSAYRMKRSGWLKDSVLVIISQKHHVTCSDFRSNIVSSTSCAS